RAIRLRPQDQQAGLVQPRQEPLTAVPLLVLLEESTVKLRHRHAAHQPVQPRGERPKVVIARPDPAVRQLAHRWWQSLQRVVAQVQVAQTPQLADRYWYICQLVV